MSLHTLHLARAADGGDTESIHVYNSVSMLFKRAEFTRLDSLHLLVYLQDG